MLRPNSYNALFLIDTGAIDCMAPSSELRRAGIQPVGHKAYELADDGRQQSLEQLHHGSLFAFCDA